MTNYGAVTSRTTSLRMDWPDGLEKSRDSLVLLQSCRQQKCAWLFRVPLDPIGQAQMTGCRWAVDRVI